MVRWLSSAAKARRSESGADSNPAACSRVRRFSAMGVSPPSATMRGSGRLFLASPLRLISPPRRVGKAAREGMMDSGFAILARRLILAVPTFIVVSLLVFVVLRLLPADPVAMSLPPNATRAELAAARHDMGLDRPIPVQYAIWLGQVARGDLGTSIQSRRKVADLIVEALPTTLELVASGLALGIALGVGFGLAMFAWRGTAAEHAADLASIAVMSLPEFLWAILLILGLGVGLGWLPFIGRIDPQMRVAPVTGLLLVDTLVAGKVAAFL